ncbi:Aste57867_8678 [Aphanomyces stellatus]|uniref:Aste57867_8678 protein n=1 Tax=Aphanomyces stellatus TaxID=120398 RepID=A0A485KKW0_9STRA|nr:hypothetical protein As57867_008644 [Aphanomyces stellatus]VFT85564.1 Aste57867_8678 [Aphanomyces stellatus]
MHFTDTPSLHIHVPSAHDHASFQRMLHASPTTTDDCDSPGAVREMAPFLRNLRNMLDHENAEVLRWNKDGTAFEIHDMDTLTHTVLPKYFKHNKYTSFQRQLNYFHFKKWTKSRANVCTFSNDCFLRDDPDRSLWITRKKGLPSSRSASFDETVVATPRTIATMVAEGFDPSHAPVPEEFLMKEDLDWLATIDSSVTEKAVAEAQTMDWIQPTPYPESWVNVTAV